MLFVGIYLQLTLKQFGDIYYQLCESFVKDSSAGVMLNAGHQPLKTDSFHLLIHYIPL